MLRTEPVSHGGKLLLTVINENFNGVGMTAAANLEIHTSLLSHLVAGRKMPSLKMAVFFQRAHNIPCSAWLEPPRAMA